MSPPSALWRSQQAAQAAPMRLPGSASLPASAPTRPPLAIHRLPTEVSLSLFHTPGTPLLATRPLPLSITDIPLIPATAAGTPLALPGPQGPPLTSGVVPTLAWAPPSRPTAAIQADCSLSPSIELLSHPWQTSPQNPVTAIRGDERSIARQYCPGRTARGTPLA